MKISIITDGNNTLGLGHIYQSISLANLLVKKTNGKVNINFLTKSDEKICNLINSAGFDVKHLDNDELIFEWLKADEPGRIIFDKLNVSPILAKKIKEELGIKLIILTNLTEANNYADVTMLADIGSNFINLFERSQKTGKVQFFGPKYWILRSEFYDFKKKKKNQNNYVRDIMLIFGGSDHANLSSAVLHELLQIDSAFNILLVLGAAFEHLEELSKVLNNKKNSVSNVQVVKNISNVAENMFKSDVVFASPGLSFFEALATGTPVLGFHQNKLQQDTYREFLPTLGKNELYKLSSILKDRSFIFPDNPFISGMEIGEGKEEIVNEILS